MAAVLLYILTWCFKSFLLSLFYKVFDENYILKIISHEQSNDAENDKKYIIPFQVFKI